MDSQVENKNIIAKYIVDYILGYIRNSVQEKENQRHDEGVSNGNSMSFLKNLACAEWLENEVSMCLEILEVLTNEEYPSFSDYESVAEFQEGLEELEMDTLHFIKYFIEQGGSRDDDFYSAQQDLEEDELRELFIERINRTVDDPSQRKILFKAMSAPKASLHSLVINKKPISLHPVKMTTIDMLRTVRKEPVEKRFREFMMGAYLEYNMHGSARNYIPEEFCDIFEGFIRDGLVANHQVLETVIESLLKGSRYALDDDGMEVQHIFEKLKETVSQQIWEELVDGSLDDLLSPLTPSEEKLVWEEYVNKYTIHLRACIIFHMTGGNLKRLKGIDWDNIRSKNMEEFELEEKPTREMCLSVFKDSFKYQFLRLAEINGDEYEDSSDEEEGDEAV